MTTAWIAAGAVYFVLLGTAYVVGFDYVKRHAPTYQPHYYLLTAVVRMLLTLTLLALCIFTVPSRQAVVPIVIAWMGMYVIMMIASITLRH